jgi:hypothetical protein
MAEMLAVQSAPMMGGSERAFSQGRLLGNQFAGRPEFGDHYKKIANEAGISTHGKYYSSQLAAFPGDPLAWVSDLDDVRRAARINNLNVEGIIKQTAEPGDPDLGSQWKTGGYRVAPEIVEDAILDIVESNPEVGMDLVAHPAKLADLKENLTNKFSGNAE